MRSPPLARCWSTQWDAVDKQTAIGHLFLGGVLLAAATSLPEVVSVTSAGALREADLTIGTVLGFYLFNVAIFGAVALAAPLAIRPSSLDYVPG